MNEGHELERPVLNNHLDSRTFRNYYYLKEELAAFCRENGLPASGGKTELADRIACFLDTGVIQPKIKTRSKVKTDADRKITPDSIIESGFICSEKHRSFFKEQIGGSFSFTVPFQKWLKSNSGKTYREAIDAYYELRNEKKEKPSVIGSQFEYNKYIHDFFADNKGRTLGDAIKCWKYKKSLPGHNRYEKSDTEILLK